MLRAIWEWCADAGLTPQILVNARHEGVSVPKEYVKDGGIVLNIHDRAVRDLRMDNESVSFSARFAGQSRNVFVPMEAILAVYARENGQGLFFEVPVSETETTDETHGDQAASEESNDTEHPTPPRGKPNLKLV